MALTRPRYSQIPDSDYKNSCRIVTTTDVTLTSGTPLTYDGVTLVQYDRVLVAGQTDKTQNGIYSVSTLGSGSNGTWVRSKDANANDRLTAGMNTFIEEGTYSGQFWHLLTPGPIVLGVTELIFGQISGNAAGTSSQVQYNLNGSIAGAANLKYDYATGNVLVGGGTAATSNVTGALTVNGGIGVTGEIWAQSNIYSVGSRVLTAYDLQTRIFTANYISKDPANVSVPVVGTGTIYGTHNFGNLEAISTYGDYDTVAQSGYYSVNDASGAPGFIVYVGFTGITSFNRAVFNINYTQLSGHTITLDFYNYDTDAWDPFATYSGLGNWQAFTLGVIDANPYIDAAGNVTTRVYHVSSGNTAHRTWIDYVALEQSITGGQGPRGATGATGPSGTYSGGYIVGTIITGGNIITSGNIVSNSGNVSVSTTTGAIILTGEGGAGIGGNIFAGGNITANAFYTLNGLFWSGNGQAFSRGLEVSEINTANALSNISTQVTSLRFDRDTGFSVTELNPGNIKVSLGSSFKTWHVPGQTDLVAVAEDEVTFFGNGIDITTNPTYPKSLTFIANNSVLEANISAYQLYANANAATQQVEINSLASGANTNTAAYLTTYTGNISAGNINITSNLYIQNVNILSNIVTQSQILDGTIAEFSAITNNLLSNDIVQSESIDAIAANLNAFQYYANTKIGTNNNSNLVVTSTTDSVSAITGALTVAGGVGIGGNLYVAGNIFASNLIAINSTTLEVQDPLLYLNASSPYPYNYDIGFYSHFVGGGPTEHYQHTGIVRDYTNSVWNFFSNITAEPGTTVDWTEGNLIYDSVRAGEFIVANATASTSEFSGALRVAGGAGVAGALYIANTGDVSANIGTIKTDLAILDANIGAFETYANVYLGTTTTFHITQSGFSEYLIEDLSNPVLHLFRGQVYKFSVSTVGNPFWIKTAPSIGSGDQYNTGIINNGTASGMISFEVPLDAPDILYYVSQFDAAMTNQLIIVNFSTIDANVGTLFLGNASTNANLGAFQIYANTSLATLDANVGTLFLGNASTNANLGAFQTYTNTSFVTLDANIGTLFLGNASTNANLGAFQTYANATFTTYSNANVTAYLPTHTGNISAGNVNADKFYTTSGVYWSGNGNPYSTGGGGGGITYTAATTPPVGPAVGDQWYDTAEGILYEYMDDGDTDQWVDIISPTFSGANPIAFDSNITVTGNIFIGDGIFWSANGDPYASGSGSFSGSDDVLRANVGAYQIYANANIGTLYLGNISTNSNLGAYQTWANSSLQILDANIGTLYLGNISTQANLGAFQTYANNRLTILDANIGTLFLGNASTNANLGAYQTWANSNFSTSTYSNTNVAAYLTQSVTIGSGSTTSNLVVAATTASTNTTTGALVVVGGAGIAGAVHVGSSGTFAGLLQTTATTAATSTGTGALYVAGGAGIIGNLYAGGNVILGSADVNSNVVVTGIKTSTSTTTGALVVKGGVGIAGNVYTDKVYTTNGVFWSGNGAVFSPPANPIFTSNIVAASGTNSSSITTGALVVVGGAGVAQNLYVGSQIYVSDNINVTNSAYIGEIRVDKTVESRGVTTGALRVPNNGGIGVTGNIHANKLYTVNGLYWSGNAQPFTIGLNSAIDANIGTLFLGNASTNANLGAYQIWANANLGAYQTWANTNFISTDNTSANISAGNLLTAYGIYWSGNGNSFTSGIKYTASTSPPAEAGAGDQWYNTGTDILYEYLSDGTDSYWFDTTTSALSSISTPVVTYLGETFAGNLTVAGNIIGSLGYLLEKAYLITNTPTPSIVDFDILTSPIIYYTGNSTQNITVNLRGNATIPLNSVVNSGQSVTFSMFVPQGSTPYYVSTIKIDDEVVTPAWQGYLPVTSGNANSIDIYTFTAIKGASRNWRVFGSQTSYTHSGAWSFADNTPTRIEYLVVGGGGSGATSYGGGGGAGGVVHGNLSVMYGITYTVTVGAGGTAVSTTNSNGIVGTSSTFSTITANGGGYGGRVGNKGGDGGSGGGGGGDAGSGSGIGGIGNTPATSPAQGTNGGAGLTGVTSNRGAGGGGGASSAGSDGTASNGGNGGAGTNSYSAWATATSTGVGGYYAGGGGGGAITGTNVGGTGGSGGGGAGGSGANISGTAGTPNTGGGGGGMGDRPAPGSGSTGAGGSGIVILRYSNVYIAATSTTGSPTIVDSSDGYRYYTFTGDGSITI